MPRPAAGRSRWPGRERSKDLPLLDSVRRRFERGFVLFSLPTRRYLRRRGIGALIPRKKNERPQRRFDRTTYRERNAVERLINRPKRYRRIATRSPIASNEIMKGC